ncbi:MAG: winged helix family transcriptional regulator [Caldilinea sp. CFX5]|nr:winged helix family transcriptional regulator [Caldilinea sp. CFX5]
MTQQIYWHAPLWEVLLVVSSGLIMIGWSLIRAWRRPDVADALAGVHPALNEQPLFFFSPTRGIQPLNRAGSQLALRLTQKDEHLQAAILTDIAFEAMVEGRQAVKKAWPEADQTLLAIPFKTTADKVTELLLIVFTEITPPQHDRSFDLAEKVLLPLPPPPTTSTLIGEEERWLILGKEVKVHPQQPLVRVQRSTSTVDPAPSWQEERLTYLEEALLRHLWSYANIVQRAELLFATIWPDDPVDRVGLRPEQKDRLRRLVYQLRQRIEPDPRTPRYLQTAHGVGYTLYRENLDDQGKR